MSEIDTLKRRVQELETWKNAKERQQVDFPLDDTSRRIIRENSLVYLGETEVDDYFFTDLLSRGWIIDFDGNKKVIVVSEVLTKFTVNTSTNVISTDVLHDLSNDQRVAVTSSGILPDGLNETTPYFVINATGKTFQVSTTSGGSPVNITDTGTGNHYFGKI